MSAHVTPSSIGAIMKGYEMESSRKQIIDMIFSLSNEQLEQFRTELKDNVDLSDGSKEVMSKIIDSAKDTNLKFQIIKKYIDEYDIYSLLALGAPKDEYDSYSRELADTISPKDSVIGIAERIASLLDPAFSEKVNPEKYIDVATKIKIALLEQALEALTDSYENILKTIL